MAHHNLAGSSPIDALRKACMAACRSRPSSIWSIARAKASSSGSTAKTSAAAMASRIHSTSQASIARCSSRSAWCADKAPATTAVAVSPPSAKASPLASCALGAPHGAFVPIPWTLRPGRKAMATPSRPGGACCVPPQPTRTCSASATSSAVKPTASTFPAAPGSSAATAAAVEVVVKAGVGRNAKTAGCSAACGGANVGAGVAGRGGGRNALGATSAGPRVDEDEGNGATTVGAFVGAAGTGAAAKASVSAILHGTGAGTGAMAWCGGPARKPKAAASSSRHISAARTQRTAALTRLAFPSCTAVRSFPKTAARNSSAEAASSSETPTA
mmetsp:Transcript_7478/g.21284  ORF Transcript_7478/g.21284 Transcript_7478/m.21284 type:complete len:330 (+) Transcript_7478:411-1400(+)